MFRRRSPEQPRSQEEEPSEYISPKTAEVYKKQLRAIQKEESSKRYREDDSYRYRVEERRRKIQQILEALKDESEKIEGFKKEDLLIEARNDIARRLNFFENLDHIEIEEGDTLEDSKRKLKEHEELIERFKEVKEELENTEEVSKILESKDYRLWKED